MHRCVLAAAFCVALAAVSLPLPAQAQQVHRKFPKAALRGGIKFGTPPSIALDGDAARLSAAARIHGPSNLLVMSGSLVGKEAVVDYTVGADGTVREVWILRPDEVANQPWPTTPKQAAAWVFDAQAQKWSKP